MAIQLQLHKIQLQLHVIGIQQAVGGRPPKYARPGLQLQVVTRYTSYTHMDRSLTRYPCWPASTANQSGLMTLTFWPYDLESGVRVMCYVGYLYANFSLLRPLRSRLRPDVSDRQTSDRQTDREKDLIQHHHLMPHGRGHKMSRTVYL